jgi:hypothetical protein
MMHKLRRLLRVFPAIYAVNTRKSLITNYEFAI